MRPFSTARASCFSIRPMPLSRCSWSTSRTTTSQPAWAAICAIPCPINPAPRTPTFEISISLRPPFPFALGARGDYMPLVTVEDRGAVRHVVLNRAEKRNALSGEVVQALGDAFRGAAGDDSVRVVVVRGEGVMFSSGMDLADLRALSENPRGLRSYRREILAIWNLLEEMPKATICQIHGACLGGAMELALACDMRVMAEDAVAGVLEARIGLLPDVGGCSRLPAVVGVGRAKELVMTGKVIDGREAHRIGFANRIAPADELDAATTALCDELLACAPLAGGLSKRIVDASARPARATTLEQEVAAQERLAPSDDFAKGRRRSIRSGRTCRRRRRSRRRTARQGPPRRPVRRGPPEPWRPAPARDRCGSCPRRTRGGAEGRCCTGSRSRPGSRRARRPPRW